MRDHQQRFCMRSMCRVLGVHPSGYYAWGQAPLSARARDDWRLSSLVKRYWLERGGVYGYRKGHDDLCAQGETCGKHRVARLMRQAGLKAQVG
jgi:putative transposase